jgi:hypothetical protein
MDLEFDVIGVDPSFTNAIRFCSSRLEANPAIVSYNASDVKIYTATRTLVGFKNKYFHFTLKNALAYYIAGVVAVNSKVVAAGWPDWTNFFRKGDYLCTLGSF